MISFKDIFNNVKDTCVEHSPEILIGLGIVGSVATTIIACKATLYSEKIMHRRKDELKDNDIEFRGSRKDKEPEKYNRNRIIINANAAKDIIIAYGPAITLGVLSISSIMCGYKIISKRHVALMAAYNVMEKSFATYRQRVITEFGKTKDDEIMHGVTTEEIEVKEKDKNGKIITKKIKKQRISGKPVSDYARWFTEPVSYESYQEALLRGKTYPKEATIDDYQLYAGNPNFAEKEYNRFFLVSQEKNANDILHSKGYITLNEVYRMLGFDETEAGQVVGWSMKNPEGDHKVSFGLYKCPENIGYLPGSYLLDFNVDGQIIFNNKTKLAKI